MTPFLLFSVPKNSLWTDFIPDDSASSLIQLRVFSNMSSSFGNPDMVSLLLDYNKSSLKFFSQSGGEPEREHRLFRL